MIYGYSCPKCGVDFDVIKTVSEMERVENCACGATATRQFLPERIHLVGTAVEHAEYNPGLGCIVRNKQHRAEICRQKGLEEIGNEPAEKIHKHFEKKQEEKREASWAEADKGWVGSGD